MGRDLRPDLEELGLKALLLIETLVSLSQGVAERLKKSGSCREGEPRREGLRSWGGSRALRGDLEAELEAMRRRLEILEQWCLDCRPAADPAPEGGEGGEPEGTERPGPALAPSGPVPARLDRASSRQRALQAALQLRREGKPITLASVARAGGLKYSQVVYAFRRRGDLLREVEEAERAGG